MTADDAKKLSPEVLLDAYSSALVNHTNFGTAWAKEVVDILAAEILRRLTSNG